MGTGGCTIPLSPEGKGCPSVRQPQLTGPRSPSRAAPKGGRCEVSLPTTNSSQSPVLPAGRSASQGREAAGATLPTPAAARRFEDRGWIHFLFCSSEPSEEPSVRKRPPCLPRECLLAAQEEC